MQDSTRQSAPLEGRKPSKLRVRPILLKRPNFPTSPALLPDALQRTLPVPVPASEQVALGDLARELHVDVDHLRPLINYDYLKLVTVREYLADCTVVRPLPAAVNWLRNMFRPIALRPMWPSEMLADLLRISVQELRSLCLMYDIPLQDDPVFGELMTMQGFRKLFNHLHRYRNGARFDRQALLATLFGTDIVATKVQAHLPYSLLIEKELSRIARLPEPERTLRALEFNDAYQDAKTVAECLKRYAQPSKIEEKLNRLLKTTTALEE